VKQSLTRFLWYLLCTRLLFVSLLASDFGDVRNRDGSHTKSHFKARVYRSLSEWEDRREELKRLPAIAINSSSKKLNLYDACAC